MCLELAPIETEASKLNLTQAMLYCFSMGPGWRLPTKQEISEIASKENDLHGWYWTSTRATIEENRHWSLMCYSLLDHHDIEVRMKKLPATVRLDVRAVREL